jgi:RNAse (barnase) inhibitor barstar
VAAFDLDGPGPDYRLFRNGPVVLFHRPAALDETTTMLAERGYRIHPVDAATSKRALLTEIGARLDFPDHYGRNLDALADCLGEAITGTGIGTGLVLVLKRYDAFAARDPRAAQAILDIIAVQARHAMLFGRRLLCLAQSDDPTLRFAPVGATPILWSDH